MEGLMEMASFWDSNQEKRQERDLCIYHHLLPSCVGFGHGEDLWQDPWCQSGRSDLVIEVGLNDEDIGGLDAVVDGSKVVVDVVEALSKVGGNLDVGHLGREEGKIGVVGVAEAISKEGVEEVLVYKIDAVVDKGVIKEADKAAMVALSDGSEAGMEGSRFTTKGVPEDEGILAMEGATSGGGGGDKVLDGSENLGEGIEGGDLLEGVVEGEEGDRGGGLKELSRLNLFRKYLCSRRGPEDWASQAKPKMNQIQVAPISETDDSIQSRLEHTKEIEAQ
ncbi:hypothetical protein COCNU_13G007020 [Cocos nucifera]|uniref:Uncharacterized protein n=1 Tax=Cocos nucifera TaxID=13894 RepID=A0A8K0IT90_COCNU|nr:hypothetical protein COCNU_13G007020 [Cocos nucifera]